MVKRTKNNTIQYILQQYYPSYRLGHNLPLYVQKAVSKLMMCRTAFLGGHKYICPDCNKEEIVYNPCQHRSCPQCAKIGKEEWLQKQKKKLISTNYYHVVFTIPSEFNIYWLRNKKIMTNLLFNSVKETLLDMCANPNLLGVLPGIITTLHTWGGTLALHPHIHCLITDGGLTKEGKWKSGRRGKKSNKGFLLPINEHGVMGVFRAKFVFKMIGSLRKGKLILPDIDSGKNIKQIEKFYTDLKAKKWNVDIRERYNHGKGVAIYLANYLKGGPIGNSRIKNTTNGKIVFTYKNSRKNRKEDTIELGKDEFIKRLLFHIPEQRQRLVRYYGLFASNKIKELNKARRTFGQLPVEDFEREPIHIKCQSCGHELEKYELIEPRKLGFTLFSGKKKYEKYNIKKIG